MTVIAVIGSRTWPTKEDVVTFVDSLSSRDILVSGGAEGADTFAARAAAERGLQVVIHLPDEQRYGRPACYYQRNKLIVEDVQKHGGRVVAFAAKDPKTKEITAGTSMTLGIAEKEGVSFELIQTPVPGRLCELIYRLRKRYDNIQGASTPGEREARVRSAKQILQEILSAQTQYQNRLSNGWAEINVTPYGADRNAKESKWLDWERVYRILSDVIAEALEVMR